MIALVEILGIITFLLISSNFIARGICRLTEKKPKEAPIPLDKDYSDLKRLEWDPILKEGVWKDVDKK